MKENTLPKIYQITVLIAFIYSVLLLIYAIYNQFFYVDGTWFHGFIANGFTVLSGLIWIGILLIFKRFLNHILNYNKGNVLINLYLIFLGITTLSFAMVIYESVKVYLSFEEGNTFNSLVSFSGTSILGAILLFISNFAIILISILLGNQIRKIDIIQKNLFRTLGFVFIVYGIISLLKTFSLFGTDTTQFLTKATLSILIALIIKKNLSTNLSDLNALTDFEKSRKQTTFKPKVDQREENTKPEKSAIYKRSTFKEEAKETFLQNDELPKINIEEIDDRELVLSYFKNLPQEELKRLDYIIQNKYNRNLTSEEKFNLVLHYIVEKKLYDHQRFLPK